MELVCPAGTPAALRAAVDAGADSVYCGFRNETNARNFPGLNFSDAEMAEGVAYAHAHGARVLVAINTFAKAGAMKSWADALAVADQAGADAVILADLAVLDHAARHHPRLKLHLSVQAAAATPEAIKFYADTFGVRRVVMPRVLKSDGKSEPFDEAKLRRSLMHALQKRPVTQEQIETVLSDIQLQIRRLGERDVKSRTIGEIVMQSLFALEQRLALLNNGKKLSEDSNPFGPLAIAQTFRDALTPTPFPLRIKTILYMLFDQHMLAHTWGYAWVFPNRDDYNVGVFFPAGARRQP